MSFFGERRRVYARPAEKYRENAEAAANDNKDKDAQLKERLDLADKIASTVDRGGFDDMLVEKTEMAGRRVTNLQELYEAASDPGCKVEDLKKVLSAAESANARNMSAEEKSKKLLESEYLSEDTRDNILGFLKAKQGAKVMNTDMAWQWEQFVDAQLKRQPVHLGEALKLKRVMRDPNAVNALEGSGFSVEVGGEKLNIAEVSEWFNVLTLKDKQKVNKAVTDALKKVEFNPNAVKEAEQFLAMNDRIIPNSWKERMQEGMQNGVIQEKDGKLSSLSSELKGNRESLGELAMTEKKFENIWGSTGVLRAVAQAKQSGKKVPERPDLEEFRGMSRTERYEHFDAMTEFMAEVDKEFAEAMKDTEAKDVRNRDIALDEMEASAKEEAEAEDTALNWLAQNIQGLSFYEGMKKQLADRKQQSKNVIDFQSARQKMAQRGMQVGEVAEGESEPQTAIVGVKGAEAQADDIAAKTQREEKELNLTGDEALRQQLFAEALGDDKKKKELQAALGLKDAGELTAEEWQRIANYLARVNPEEAMDVHEHRTLLNNMPQTKSLIMERGNLKKGARKAKVEEGMSEAA